MMLYHFMRTVECPVGIAWHMPAIEDDKAHELVECSNRGKCDKPTGECKCESGFTGKSCDRCKPPPS